LEHISELRPTAFLIGTKRRIITKLIYIVPNWRKEMEGDEDLTKI